MQTYYYVVIAAGIAILSNNVNISNETDRLYESLVALKNAIDQQYRVGFL